MPQAAYEGLIASLKDELLELNGPQEEAISSAFEECLANGTTPDEYDCMAVLWCQRQKTLELAKAGTLSGIKYGHGLIACAFMLQLQLQLSCPTQHDASVPDSCPSIKFMRRMMSMHPL